MAVNSSPPFASVIYPFTLKFKDSNLESSYVSARTNFELLSTSSRKFLMAVFAGYFLVTGIDFAAAISTSPGYTFTTQVWVFYSLLFPLLLCEAASYFLKSMYWCRGIPLTVLGCGILFHNNFSNFEDEVFYPFIGTE